MVNIILYRMDRHIERRKVMETIIAMQDIRQSLASITDRAEKGESFIVVRNSRPVLRIEPVTKPYETGSARTPMTVREVRERFAADPVSDDELAPADLDAIIRDVRRAPRA